MFSDTTHLSDETRADLELLLAEQDNGWCAYNNYSTATCEVAMQTGIGGCLVEQMHRMLGAQGLSPMTAQPRKYAMMVALGFSIEQNGCTIANPIAMYVWNDQQRDPDVIRHRIKEALNV